jgi:hypothetical protein
VANDRILIIEDDDWYGARYIETMAAWLATADLVGERGARYYHLATNRHRHFTSHEWPSLARTAMRRSVLATLAECAESDESSVDWLLWKRWRGSKRIEFDVPGLHVAIKSMPGRTGCTWGTKSLTAVDRSDWRQLSHWMGSKDEMLVYRRLRNGRGPKPAERVVVYTAIFGGYDRLRPPERVTRDVEWICFSDRQLNVPPWQVHVVRTKQPSASRENRWYKVLAHQVFPEADWTLYLDGSLALRREPRNTIHAILEDDRSGRERELYAVLHPFNRDAYDEGRWVLQKGLANATLLNDQLARYRRAGLPERSGCAQCGFMIRRHTPAMADFERLWWSEIERGTHRDQISFSYAAWHSGLDYGTITQTDRMRYTAWSNHLLARAAM